MHEAVEIRLEVGVIGVAAAAITPPSAGFDNASAPEKPRGT
jgi:hypothetical protein